MFAQATELFANNVKAIVKQIANNDLKENARIENAQAFEVAYAAVAAEVTQGLQEALNQTLEAIKAGDFKALPTNALVVALDKELNKAQDQELFKSCYADQVEGLGHYDERAVREVILVALSNARRHLVTVSGYFYIFPDLDKA